MVVAMSNGPTVRLPRRVEPGSPVYYPTADPNIYRSSRLANAGWYEEGQHGGALAALVAAHVDAVPSLTEMQISRFTLEIFRVVPLVELEIQTRVIREGKRIQVIEARVLSNGAELSRAHVQRLRIADVGMPAAASEQTPRLTPPDSLAPAETSTWGVGPPGVPMFHRDAVEIREVEGGFHSAGSGVVWFRLKSPIVAGTEITPLQRLVAVADFANGVSRLTTSDEWLFMNPDLSININRLPAGEWVCLDGESNYASNGRGIASGTLWDQERFLGRTTQTLYLDVM